MINPSNSEPQTLLERKIYNQFLNGKDRLKHSDEGLEIKGSRIQPDISCYDSHGKLIIGEIFVRVDKSKAGQRRKIANDILKLISFREVNQNKAKIKLVVLLYEDLYSDFVNSKSWLSKVCSVWDVELKTYSLDDDEIKSLQMAVDQQAIGNRRKDSK